MRFISVRGELTRSMVGADGGRSALTRACCPCCDLHWHPLLAHSPLGWLHRFLRQLFSGGRKDEEEAEGGGENLAAKAT